MYFEQTDLWASGSQLVPVIAGCLSPLPHANPVVSSAHQNRFCACRHPQRSGGEKTLEIKEELWFRSGTGGRPQARPEAVCGSRACPGSNEILARTTTLIGIRTSSTPLSSPSAMCELGRLLGLCGRSVLSPDKPVSSD